jgi:hypothetical protein
MRGLQMPNNVTIEEQVQAVIRSIESRVQHWSTHHNNRFVSGRWSEATEILELLKAIEGPREKSQRLFDEATPSSIEPFNLSAKALAEGIAVLRDQLLFDRIDVAIIGKMMIRRGYDYENYYGATPDEVEKAYEMLGEI